MERKHRSPGQFESYKRVRAWGNDPAGTQLYPLAHVETKFPVGLSWVFGAGRIEKIAPKERILKASERIHEVPQISKVFRELSSQYTLNCRSKLRKASPKLESFWKALINEIVQQVLGKPEVVGSDWGRGQVRASCIAGGTSPKRVRACETTARGIGNDGLRWLGTARRWWSTLCWRCVQAGESSGESGTARKMVTARGEGAAAAWVMENRHRHRDAGRCWCVIAGGARRVGGAQQEEPSNGEVVARGAGEGEDWVVRGGERERRVAHARDSTHAGGTASGTGEGRDSRAAGREQRGDGMQMQASLTQRRMLVVARDVVGEVGGRRGRDGRWARREAARGGCTRGGDPESRPLSRTQNDVCRRPRTRTRERGGRVTAMRAHHMPKYAWEHYVSGKILVIRKPKGLHSSKETVLHFKKNGLKNLYTTPSKELRRGGVSARRKESGEKAKAWVTWSRRAEMGTVGALYGLGTLRTGVVISELQDDSVGRRTTSAQGIGRARGCTMKASARARASERRERTRIGCPKHIGDKGGRSEMGWNAGNSRLDTTG
ncbi:hypothetical protein B0H16DRAFT_1685964 [Mycena metata]|uniref:Uncharacterized protein n=1 Tax=Mycena metata TaxID=1033252 RepID=A0AAD7JQJ7_9AGAR|nr:hypothetical protein B0H16DRAFT_1685964 [Mycena metata]